MEHSTIYKNKDRYSSFPLVEKHKDRLKVGFFVAPVPDHTGIYEWIVFDSFDNGNTWEESEERDHHYYWPSVSSREISDRYAFQIDGRSFVVGSSGFKTFMDLNNNEIIIKSNRLFMRSSCYGWKGNIKEIFYLLPTVDIILTFPRPMAVVNTCYMLLIPAYAILKNGNSRAFAWRSTDDGKTWNLYNMFPDEINANEMAFIWTNQGILAHIRSDDHPYLLESRSYDGITWTYPTTLIVENGYFYSNVIGGPPHLLRLNNNDILCSYGYRLDNMGIRAIISKDDGQTWHKPIILREDGGYLSSLRGKRYFWQQKIHPGNDVGYPVSIQLDSGEILTVYYITCEDGVTHIASTKWTI